MKTLVRSLETGVDRQVLPVGSAVTVASGAALAVEGSHITTNAISGAGDVVLRNGARFCATDWSGFTGSVTGIGELVVARGCQGPVSAQVSVPVSFQDGVISVSAANLTQPIVRTTGKVFLRDVGRLEMAPNSGLDDIAGRRFKIAECSGVVGPADASEWTFAGKLSNVDGTFIYADGVLYARVKGGGMVLFLK